MHVTTLAMMMMIGITPITGQSPTGQCLTSETALVAQQTRGNYNLTLFSIFKMEKFALRQWVLHHIAEGVDHFVLVDNNTPSRSATPERCELQPFIEAGVVTMVEDPTSHALRTLGKKHLAPFLPRSEWILSVDLDEFAFARGGRAGADDGSRGAPTIWSFVSGLSAEVTLVRLPWRMFAGAGAVEPVSIAELTTTEPPKANTTVPAKWIARGADIEIFAIHHPRMRFRPDDGNAARDVGDGTTAPPCSMILPNLCCALARSTSCECKGASSARNTCPPDTDGSHAIYLNHYSARSREFYGSTKMPRGDGMLREWDRIRDWKYFATHHKFMTATDTELRDKRRRHHINDQRAVDELICERHHPGGRPPKWCAYRSTSTRGSTR